MHITCCGHGGADSVLVSVRVVLVVDTVVIVEVE